MRTGWRGRGFGPSLFAYHDLMRTCLHCKVPKKLTEFRSAGGSREIDNRRRICKTCERPRMNAHQKRWQDNQRAKALALLGGVCCKCGFADHRALQIDHINGGGNRENRAIGNGGVIRKVLAGESGYQLLCANCNWIKRYENDETKRKTQQST